MLYLFYFRFNPDKIEVTEFKYKSQYPHKYTKIMNYQNGIFAVGDAARRKKYGKAELFNFGTNRWIEMDDYPEHDISDYAAVSIDESHLLYFGGECCYESSNPYNGYKPVDDVVSFQDNKWNKIGKMKKARNGHGVIKHSSDVYIIGGQNNLKYSSLKSEKWKIGSNQSQEIGTKLYDYDFYPLLYVVTPDKCT